MPSKVRTTNVKKVVVRMKLPRKKNTINYDTLPIRPTAWIREHMFEKREKNESIPSRKTQKKRR